MLRGEVWWVSFGPGQGGEIQKARPALILSNDASNTFLNRLQVVPLTSNTTRIYPSEAYVTLNGELRKALCDQIMTVSKARLGSRAGVLGPEDITRVEAALMRQLALL